MPPYDSYMCSAKPVVQIETVSYNSFINITSQIRTIMEWPGIQMPGSNRQYAGLKNDIKNVLNLTV